MIYPERWLACRQNEHDRIRFIESSNPEEISSMSYYRFLEFALREIVVQRQDKFREKIDTFRKLLIDLDTGEWEEFEEEKDWHNATYEDLLELNSPEDEPEQKRDGRKLTDFLWNKKREKSKGSRLFLG